MTTYISASVNETGDECDQLISDNKPDDMIVEFNTNSNKKHLLTKLFYYLSSNTQIVHKHKASFKPLSTGQDGGLSTTTTTQIKVEGLRIKIQNLENRRKSYTTTNTYCCSSLLNGFMKPKFFRLFLTLVVSMLLITTFVLFFIKLVALIQEHKLVNERHRTIINSAYDPIPTGANKQQEVIYDDDKLNEANNERWLVSSPKCHIPNIEPWHKSILDYVKMKPQLNCTDILLQNGTKQASLTYVKGNRLYFTKNAIELGVLKSDSCCYIQVTRNEEDDDHLIFNETCKIISENGLKAPFELIQIECPIYNYTNVHAFIMHDREEEEALKRIAAKKLNANQYYNVVLVGVDTISRLNGYRQLNKTLALLKDKYQTIEFFGYNKVGENTFPNLVPLLTGLIPEQLTQTQCWLASNYSQDSETGDDYLDNCKYLWNYYQELGYITYFSEDWPKASTFNYLKQGFKRAPTSYYGRPFTLARDKLLFPYVNMGCTSCLLDKPIVEIDLANLKSFLQEQNKLPHFAFHWINCPQHDDLNGASQVDYILEQFFADIHNITQARNTFVLFFSDHGYRWNNFVSTRVGHYESSLPQLTIATPKQFIEKHPDLYENLKRHQSALLTPFDIFKTLIDIRNLGMIKQLKQRQQTNISKTTIEPRSKKTNKQFKLYRYEKVPSNNSAKLVTKLPIKNRIDELVYTSGPTASTTIQQLKPQDGLSYKQDFKIISLLSEQNSTQLDRSCIEAGIPDNYCVCHEFESIDISSIDVVGAAYYLVYVHLYTRIRDHKQICHFLDLKEINKAELFDFKHMKSIKTTPMPSSTPTPTPVSTPTSSRKKREDFDKDAAAADDDNDDKSIILTTTSRPIESNTEELVIDESHYLPNKEYNLRVSTKPGTGLFQEVVRFYGDNMESCKLEIGRVIKIIQANQSKKNHNVKHISVMRMNKVCKFSIHGDSISRLSLYKDESICVKSNIELKKICLCRDM